MRPDPYSAHDRFFAPARASSDLRSFLIVLVAYELAFMFSPQIIGAISPSAYDAMATGTSAAAELLSLALFGVSGAALVAMVRKIHNRGFWSLVGPPVLAAQDFWRVSGAVGVVLVALEIFPPWIAMAEIETVRSVGRWLLLLPIVGVVVLIQAGTEELLFRGYMQQQCAAISRSPLSWMVVPSLAFGVGHYFNGYGPADGVLYMIWASCLGLACADLTARTGSIGAAVGLHWANNMFAILIVGMTDYPGSGLALLLYPYDDPAAYDYGLAELLSPWAVIELLNLTGFILVLWLAARIALRR